MISDKTKIPIKTSDPVAVVKQLEGNSYRVHFAHTDAGPIHHTAAVQKIDSVLTRVEAPVAGTTAAEHFQHSDQTQQLLNHLQEKERFLTKQEVKHHVRAWNWQQEVARTQQELDRQKTNLNQQEQQLRNLQFEILQLQNQLIESQLATREIVNELRIPGQQEYALQTLKLELNQRFDHVLTSWRAFASEMQKRAEQSGEQEVC